MPGALVRAVESIYVSLPRWSLLPGWFAGLWPSGARIVPISLQGRRWKVADQSWRNANSRTCSERLGEGDARRNHMRRIQSRGGCALLLLRLDKPILETLEHPVPRESASWFYVFGSAALMCF